MTWVVIGHVYGNVTQMSAYNVVPYGKKVTQRRDYIYIYTIVPLNINCLKLCLMGFPKVGLGLVLGCLYQMALLSNLDLEWML